VLLQPFFSETKRVRGRYRQEHFLDAFCPSVVLSIHMHIPGRHVVAVIAHGSRSKRTVGFHSPSSLHSSWATNRVIICWFWLYPAQCRAWWSTVSWYVRSYSP